MSLDLITVRDPRAPAAEAYRTLRTNLQFSSLDHPIHTLLVTSSAPNEGKSVLLANLAVTLAQAEQRVIVADCDLRRPMLHSLFGVSNEQGLGSALLDETAALPLVQTEIEGLWLLPSGPLPPRPADVVVSKRMDLLIKRLREQADIVLFDAPPLMAASDATVLATKVDAVVLAARSGKTRRDHARESVDLLNKVNANVVGVVLTDAQRHHETYAAY